MGTRQALILAIAVVLGCLIVGVFFGQPFYRPRSEAVPAAGGSPRGPRFQILVVPPLKDGAKDTSRSYVYILDTETGDCWRCDAHAPAGFLRLRLPQ
jgi:hypothetical protein